MLESLSPPSPSGLRLPARLGYQPVVGGYDEMLLPNGDLRPHWRVFGSLLEACTTQDIQARLDTVQRLLHDHGVNFNIFDDALGTSRPWALDLIPFIVEAREARAIAEGLEQRGRLLDAILADIYGPQRLIKEGWIPPPLLAANPGFLRPAVGVDPLGGRFLRNLGCDLVRSTGGTWHVLADRTDAISGQGYALENRIILADVFPEEFNAARVQRLAGYFDTERESLRALAGGNPGGASICLQTPGPRSDTYFEHAFKARYLGLPLVESADLTVRDRHLYLKTLDGLRRVDVLVRRIQDRQSDPLLIDDGSNFGVPGLVEAWRNGGVALVNGIGAGVVGTPALHPFMVGLCRHLLGEELKIPGVPTWWCGQRREMEMVLADPERWVLKQAFVRGARDPIFLAQVDSAARATALAQVKAAPHLWVAQEALPLSTTPTWVKGHLEPRPVVWRSYLTASGGGYVVMPGGLSCVSQESSFSVTSMRSGGISKDTWVLTDGPVVEKTLLSAPLTVISTSRPPSAVPSRLADHLYWLGRYAERVEQVTRILRAALKRLSGEDTAMQTQELESCIHMMAGMGLVAPSEPTSKLNSLLQNIIFDLKHDRGLQRLIDALKFNAFAARDRLSDDTWRIFNRIVSDARQVSVNSSVPLMLATLDKLVINLAAFAGMQNENMTHGHGWRFSVIGRRIERAMLVAELIRAAIKSNPSNEASFGPLLEICDSTMTYRRLHFSRPQIAQTAFLLMQDTSNPRSIGYRLITSGLTSQSFPALLRWGMKEYLFSYPDEAGNALKALDLQGMITRPQQAAVAIPPTCTQVMDHLQKLSSAITEHYFSHAARRVH